MKQNWTYLVGGVGVAVASVMSWSVNHSFFWAVFHGLAGWFYVAYRLLGFGGR